MTNKAVLKDLNPFRKFAGSPLFLFVAILVLVLAGLLKFGKGQSSPSISPTRLDQIIKNNDSAAFTKMTYEIGPQKSYELLKQKFPKNDAAAHDFAHIIGIVAHDQAGITNLKVCDTAYNYGCYHGFIEAFIAQNGVKKVSGIEQGCIALGPVHAPSCLHGIGHGVMVDSSYNLETALGNCSVLKETSQIYCWDGVFMERIVGSMLTAENKPMMTRNNLREPCDSVKITYKEQCWRNQVAAWFTFFNGNTKDVAIQCSLVEVQYQKTCFESLGLLVTITVGENQQSLVSSCQVFPANQISDDCLVGAIKELLFEGKNPDIAKNLCQSVSAANRPYCLQVYNDHYSQSQTRFGPLTDPQRLLQ